MKILSVSLEIPYCLAVQFQNIGFEGYFSENVMALLYSQKVVHDAEGLVALFALYALDIIPVLINVLEILQQDSFESHLNLLLVAATTEKMLFPFTVYTPFPTHFNQERIFCFHVLIFSNKYSNNRSISQIVSYLLNNIPKIR